MLWVYDHNTIFFQRGDLQIINYLKLLIAVVEHNMFKWRTISI